MASVNVFPVLDIEKASGTTQKMRRTKNVDPGILTSQPDCRQRQVVTGLRRQTVNADKRWIRTREGRRETPMNIVSEEIDPARYYTFTAVWLINSVLWMSSLA